LGLNTWPRVTSQEDITTPVGAIDVTALRHCGPIERRCPCGLKGRSSSGDRRWTCDDRANGREASRRTGSEFQIDIAAAKEPGASIGFATPACRRRP
jgi:hypothetical protein